MSKIDIVAPPELIAILVLTASLNDLQQKIWQR